MVSSVYRGEIVALQGGKVTLKQAAPGFDYGSENMQFSYDDKLETMPEMQRFKAGFYAEILYNPKDGKTPHAAIRIKVISPAGNDTVVNGEIRLVSQRVDTYYITVNKMQESGTFDAENIIIIIAKKHMLEGITAAQLAIGTKISVVTNGISTMSIPPQMPAHAILPLEQKAK